MICGHHDMREAHACKNSCGRCVPCCAALCVPATGPRQKREGPPPVAAKSRPTGNRSGVGRGNARRVNTPECGTRGGHRKHLREGTTPCSECSEASARWRLDTKRFAA